MMNLFAEIVFNKEEHTYTLNGRALPSVTGLLKQVKPPFEREYWAERKAAERGVPAEAVLAEWEEAGRRSMAYGREVHAYIEQMLLGVADPGDPFLRLTERLPEMESFERFWGVMAGEMTVQHVEWVIGDAELGVAGTTDAVLFSPETGRYHLWDWKTGGKFNTHNRFGRKLLPPFEYLDDCELSVYSLQLSAYRLVVERNTDLAVGDGYILHLGKDGYFRAYQALDLRDAVKAWLTGLGVSDGQAEGGG